MAAKGECWMSWTCPYCFKNIEAPSNLIENAVKKHLTVVDKIDAKVQEHILRSLQEKRFRKLFECIRRKYMNRC